MHGIFQGLERRRFRRAKVDFSVSYLIREPMDVSMAVDGKNVKTIMFDISEEGIAIKSYTEIPSGALLMIDFKLLYASKEAGDVKRDMHIEGRIVNRKALADKAFRYGIHFEKIAPEDRAAIADFIRCFLGK
ncbi:MAG: PilZ domain-containing protein [Deltaproteobacteria bacterium]